MKNINQKKSDNFHFLVVKFSIYLNRHVFVMNLLLPLTLHQNKTVSCVSFPRQYMYVRTYVRMYVHYSERNSSGLAALLRVPITKVVSTRLSKDL